MSKRSNPSSSGSDTVIPLDNKKQVTVRKFNNINLVDIREFYEDKVTKEKKPGKKGISLTEEVWKKLMNAREEIDEALEELNGGSTKKARTTATDTTTDTDTTTSTTSGNGNKNSEPKSEKVVHDSDDASEEE